MNELLTIIFNLFIFPFEKVLLHKRRKELITNVKGKVLEIGSGGGVNFNYYSSKNIELLNVLDLKFNKFIMNHKLNKEMNINYITANAEKLPFDDKSFDTVVATLVLCSIDNPNNALEEIHRVLKDDGKLIFIEHVIPHEKFYRDLAHYLNGTWKKIGKCNINCDTYKNIENANFKISNYETFGNKVFVFIKGIAYKI